MGSNPRSDVLSDRDPALDCSPVLLCRSRCLFESSFAYHTIRPDITESEYVGEIDSAAAPAANAGAAAPPAIQT
ncbi:hypothetical protein EVAR_33213_1 [Eumeta japonica]|uniref:Uncharacterized protein n=1 Tax=Eumeta variegata TaxID=151549 RepID=A0A4C1W1C7_EUMVA|nr:hypothetical protein EVAR_33213_1 [Eumeta japonica]